MTKTFKIPFATQGDRTSIPNEVQADGAVSYTQGYGYDYERDQVSDPAAKDIEREKMNGIFHDITEAVGEIQTFGVSKWSEEGKPYPIRSLVNHKNKLWQSKVENNEVEPVSGAQWAELKADASASDVGAIPSNSLVQTTGQSTTQIMSQKAATDAIADAKKAGTNAQTTADSAASAASAAQSSANSAASAANAAQSTANTAKSTADSANTNANNRIPSSSITQTTGQSTTQIMSQKAATDAIADAKKAGTNAQTTANSAASAASAAQSTANTANTAAANANTAATNANNNANSRVPSSSIVQSTGQSTTQIMSQKAITDALAAKGGNNTALKAANGWWKCGVTGVIFQWGTASNNVEKVFPIAFPNACTSVTVIYGPGATETRTTCINKKTNTSFIGKLGSNNDMLWMAMGY